MFFLIWMDYKDETLKEIQNIKEKALWLKQKNLLTKNYKRHNKRQNKIIYKKNKEIQLKSFKKWKITRDGSQVSPTLVREIWKRKIKAKQQKKESKAKCA